MTKQDKIYILGLVKLYGGYTAGAAGATVRGILTEGEDHIWNGLRKTNTTSAKYILDKIKQELGI
jgi:hypothetical protein